LDLSFDRLLMMMMSRNIRCSRRIAMEVFDGILG
jgi:hypothetical protein